MKIVLISGLSGSGKSVALKQLEDSGFYCVDNLPLEMLPSLVLYHIERGEETQLGVSVDIRSGINIQEAQEQIQYLRDEGHQVEEHAGHEFHETRVGHGLREVACQMLLDEEEVIVLEVAERAKMIAQQDGHDFALGHLSFTVSHALIALVYGSNV